MLRPLPSAICAPARSSMAKAATWYGAARCGLPIASGWVHCRSASRTTSASRRTLRLARPCDGQTSKYPTVMRLSPHAGRWRGVSARCASAWSMCCKTNLLQKHVEGVTLPACESYLRNHIRNVPSTEGLSALTINGHTLEVSSCTFDEQRRVLEKSSLVLLGKLPRAAVHPPAPIRRALIEARLLGEDGRRAAA